MPTLSTFFADLVREASSATGTGPLALAGALPGHRRFTDVVPPGESFFYAIAGITRADQWETGVGAIDTQGRLVRSSVTASSAAGARVDFGTGLKAAALTVGAPWYSAASLPPPPPLIADIAGLQGALDAKLSAASLSPYGLTLANSADAAAARGQLAVGSIAVQSAGAVALTGGTINGVAIGTSVRAAVTCAALNASSARVESSGGAIIDFRSNTAVATKSGEFSMDAGGNMIFRNSSGGGQYFDIFNGQMTVRNVSAGYAGVALIAPWQIGPSADNAATAGSAAQRYATVYAATGTINTSDAREKHWRGAMTDAERAAAQAIGAELGFFKWHDAIADKGATGARLHFGVRAQGVWRIMAEHGLIEPIGKDGRPGKTPYAFLCFDAWDDQTELDEHGYARVRQPAGDRYGVRSDQLALFLVAALFGKPRKRTARIMKS